MDKADIAKQLSKLIPPPSRKPDRRCLRVYAEGLDQNFTLFNPSGRAMPSDIKFSLAKKGIHLSWKKGAGHWPHKVNLVEILVMVEAQLSRSKSKSGSVNCN